jgi:hypothetical protein
MKTKIVEVKVKGDRYLMNKFTGKNDEKTGKKQKKVYVPEIEAQKKEYRSKDGKLFIPSTQFEATMQKAGADFVMEGRKKYGQYLKGGIFIEQEEIPITPNKYEIFECPVVINRSRVLAWRPMFKDWSCEFTINITDDMIDTNVLKEILMEAGKHKGVGDWRPKFGRFEVVSWKVKET